MIHADILNQAGISYEAGIKRFMSDAELYEAVLTAFIGEDILERAVAAYEAEDFAMLLRVVHEAKGSGGNAGLDALYTQASALVKLLRSPSYTEDALSREYDRFIAVYSATKDAIIAALGK